MKKKLSLTCAPGFAVACAAAESTVSLADEFKGKETAKTEATGADARWQRCRPLLQ